MKLFNHVGGIDPIEMSAEMVNGKRMYLTPEGYKFPSVTTVISNNAKKKANIARWRAREERKKQMLKPLVLQVAAQSITLLQRIILTTN